MDLDKTTTRAAQTLCKVVCLACVLVFLPEASYFQSRDVMTSSQLLNEINKSYRLNSRDIKSLAPLVDKERRDVLRIYARFSGDEPEYSERVWQRVIAQRQDFEASMATDLAPAQVSVLRVARTRFEGQMLKQLVADYVMFLDRSLELDSWQFDDVASLFEAANTQVYKAFTQHSSNPTLLLKEIERIEENIQHRMKKILNEDQWRDYKMLFEADGVVGVLA